MIVKTNYADFRKELMMVRFEMDYALGAYEPILERLMETNYEQTSGYGIDPHCENAEKLIKTKCNNENISVHFMVGGTQANTTVIASLLKPYQGVLSAVTGHINVHETGAIESTGHKVLTIPTENGKITAKDVREQWELHHNDSGKEHCVQPGMVYISQPTELGTLYCKEELVQLREICDELKLPLFLDGARLGYALGAKENDISLEDLAKLCDIFYIGGTKQGALFGEAVVISNGISDEEFRYMMKQRGGLLAKGRLLGIQFEVLFEDNAYEKLGTNAVNLAKLIEKGFKEKGYGMFVESPTNQQFPILPNTEIERLKEKFGFSFWEKIDEEHSAVRFCTSWATTREQVELLLNEI